MMLSPRSKQLAHTSRPPRTFLVVSLSLICGLLISGCGEDGPTLSEVKEFDAYPLYYAGDEIAGNELDRISGADDWQDIPDQRSVGFTFFYGTCDSTADGPFDDSGCAPPAQIQVSSTCRRWASTFHRRRDLYDFRGAKATGGKGGLEGGSPIEIFTGRTTVVIWSRDRNLLETAARELRHIRAARPQSLPPPVPGSLWGKLPCQRKPG